MNIFIACSAKDNLNNKYIKLAKDVAEYYNSKGYKLIFGAYAHGMMKVINDIFGNDTIGVTIDNYKDDLKELSNQTNYIENNSFFRLNKMYELADICMILPGGTGSLNELFGILEEKRCLKSSKRLLLFNYEGFYDSLIDFLQNNELINDSDLNNLEIVTKIEEL